MFNFFKKRQIKSIEQTIDLLLAYHAMKPSSPQFTSTYRHLFALYFMLCDQTKSKPKY